MVLVKNHDKIRGVPGLFEKAVWTYRELSKLEEKYSNFNLNVAVYSLGSSMKISSLNCIII